jgi:hypothetical protein
MRALLLLIAICLTSVAHAEEPSNAVASAHFKQGVNAFNLQQYTEASDHFAKAYEIEPLADLLWSWAQAERFAGHCVTAMGLYRKYEREAQTPSKAAAARDMVALCAQQVPAAKPWYTNKLGGALATGGVVGVGLGITFLVLSSSSRDASQGQMYLDDFEDKLDEATFRRRVGAVSLGLGTAALAGAIFVYVSHGREQRSLTAGTDGRVVFVGARF